MKDLTGLTVTQRQDIGILLLMHRKRWT